jgi:hypothetical protein
MTSINVSILSINGVNILTRTLLATIGACVLLTACMTQQKLEPLTSSQASPDSVANSPGPASSFALTDPVTDKPLANKPYYIFFHDRHIVRANSDVTVITDQAAEGVTDAGGRTGTIYLDAPDNGDHVLLERYGNGKYGGFFVLTSQLGRGMVVRQWYELRGCTPKDVYRGFSNKDGFTVYFTSDSPCKMQLRVGHEYAPEADSRKNP